MAHRLREQRRRRDAGTTPEPRGDIFDPAEDTAHPRSTESLLDPALSGGQAGRFVIHQHDAALLHWDLRFAHDGILMSWALPQGLPWSPDRDHPAVHAVNRPLQYLTFQGHIPDGGHGAGLMTVWDEGTYVRERITDSELRVVLTGRRAEGRYSLYRADGRQWRIRRMDPPADPDRQHPPARYRLIKPGRGPRPGQAERGWALERNWPGLRCVLVSSDGAVELLAHGRMPVNGRFAEVRTISRALGGTEVALDGVVTTAAGGPASFVAFDLLWQDGHPVTAEPWRDRRRRLELLALEGRAWTTASVLPEDSPAWGGNGDVRLVAKRTDAPYQPDADPPPWRLLPRR